MNKGCGLASSASSCEDGITGTCACTTDLCNAAVRAAASVAAVLCLAVAVYSFA